MFTLNKLTTAIFLSGIIAGTPAIASDNNDADNGAKVSTAPSTPVGDQNKNLSARSYAKDLADYNEKAKQSAKADDKYPGYDVLPNYDETTTYNFADTAVKFNDGTRYGVFKNKWYVAGEAPNFDSSTGAWELVARTNEKGQYLTEAESVEDWSPIIAYIAGSKVKHSIDAQKYYFEARGWVQGEEPILLGADDPEWMSTWRQTELSGGSPEGPTTPPLPPVTPEEPTPPAPPVTPEEPTPPPVVPEEPTPPPVTPEEPTPPPPPVIPVPPSEEVPPPPPPVSPDVGEDNLPADGYAFLRELTTENWEWFFPLRSGKYNAAGGERNLPPFANPDGSTDAFTLDAFKAAVVEYNTWAEVKGYKTFLNEGSKSQQAAEFVTFWAKSARETSGTWAGAPPPWIVNDKDAGTVWKGALYWIEEIGYSTDEHGISPVSAYVDPSSEYTPAPGRSYYGRGVIQLSWNYNYGAFSAWLFDNGMMRDVITARDTLLKRPDFVATDGKLSVMSGIWFWMTPQGAKPSSHDVVYGDVTNISQSSQEQGLPPRNDGGQIPVYGGETSNQAVVAYRLGTVINIVNGGLECNKAASWHSGPMQRVSYYNAFALYMNSNVEGSGVPVVDAATNVWTQNVTEQSDDNLKTATCYAQKSYYTW